MAEQGRWFKLWCSASDDDDLDNLDVADFGRWCKLGAHIKVHGTNGKLTLHPPQRTLCAKLQINTFEDLILVLKSMPHCTLNEEQISDPSGVTDASVTYTFTFDNWKKYQEDSSWLRMRKKREEDANSVTNKKRGEEKRGEEKRREYIPPAKKAIDLSYKLLEIISRNCPERRQPTDAQLDKWAIEADRLNRIDNMPWERIEAVMMWATSNDFWKANILSMGKLREKWTTLVAQMERDKKKTAQEPKTPSYWRPAPKL